VDDKELQFRKTWYIDDIRDDLLPAIEAGDVAYAVQKLYLRYACNAGDNDKGVLDGDDLAEFIRLTERVATSLPDAALITDAPVPEFFKRFLLRLRRNVPTVGASTTVNLRSIIHIGGDLIIEGYFDTEHIGELERLLEPPDAPESAEPEYAGPGIVLMAGDKEIPLPDAGHVADRRYFGRTLVSFRTFEAVIDLSRLSENSEIWFSAAGQSGAAAAGIRAAERCRIIFAEPEAGISPGLGCLYKDYGDFALEYDPKKNSILACRPSVSRRIQNETRALRCVFKARLPFPRALAELGLRAAYFLTKWYFGPQKIRLYYDKIYMGGDNGQYQFMYSFDRNRAEGGPVGRHRYLASRDSAAYFELKRDGYKVHAWESLYRKLLALHADVVCATHDNVMARVGLNTFERRYCADLFSAHVVCIQHGLTIRNVPQYRARYIDNTEIYFCASEKEAANLHQRVYGYEPDALRITGLPRYDGLVSDPDRIVLFAPTWRRSAAAEAGRVGTAREWNPAFKGTAYFETYRDLLTDEALTTLLFEKGFRLVFLLHPALSAQARDFAEYAGGPIEVVSSAEKGYEQYLRRAAILVTDYCGVQFDFAYMRKPIVYYRPEALPPNYGSAAFDNVEVAFGPETGDVPGLLGLLSGIMDHNVDDPGGPGMLTVFPDAEYEERMRSFFVFDDRENRGRIYDVIREEYGG
jgi:hypothetical protein